VGASSFHITTPTYDFDLDWLSLALNFSLEEHWEKDNDITLLKSKVGRGEKRVQGKDNLSRSFLVNGFSRLEGILLFGAVQAIFYEAIKCIRLSLKMTA
jgi:hypothetical protein